MKGRKVVFTEELAYILGYISKGDLINLDKPIQNNQYGKYLIEKVIN
jgi:dTDP-glucose pyrophosphorylase